MQINIFAIKNGNLINLLENTASWLTTPSYTLSLYSNSDIHDKQSCRIHLSSYTRLVSLSAGTYNFILIICG